MTNDSQYRPLSAIAEVAKPASAPPEPPSRPFSGPAYEERTGNLFCKVPGCSKAAKGFRGRHTMAIHLIRRHALTIEGKARLVPEWTRPAALAPAQELRYVSVRGILTPDQVSLIGQAARIVQTAKENLSGKLTEMDALRLKAAKLDAILTCIRELLPDGGQNPGGQA